jgi:hypothetical protein
MQAQGVELDEVWKDCNEKVSKLILFFDEIGKL